jgi:branched-chain amino acid transport system ATP-binding protein
MFLGVQNVSKRFGGIAALNNVSFSVREGETVGLIGPNGAGKTTMVNVICGLYKPDSGTIKFNGEDITELPPHEKCRLGIARTYQIPRPFSGMTAINNVLVGVLAGKNVPNRSLADASFEAFYYLQYVGLERKRDILAQDLTLYELRMLELARALASRPKFLIIDEAMAGLNPAECLKAVKLIKRAQEEFKLTILWIEHVMSVIMNAANRIVVLSQGQKISEGPPEMILKDEKVINAYLGEKLAGD